MLGLMWAVKDSGKLGASPLTMGQEAALLDYLLDAQGRPAVAQFKPQIAQGVSQIIFQNSLYLVSGGGTSTLKFALVPPPAGTAPNGPQLLTLTNQGAVILAPKNITTLVGNQAEPPTIYATSDPTYIANLAGPDGEFAIVAPLTPVAPNAATPPGSVMASAGGNTFAILLGVAAVAALGFVLAGR